MDFPVPFVLVRNECVALDGEMAQLDNKLGKANNNGRKILATTVMEAFGEKLIDTPIWSAPKILPTSEGGIEIATFTEYSGQDRHKHHAGLEIYTVLKGKMEILINDEGPFVLNAMDEVVILPDTIHEVIQKKPNQAKPGSDEFALLVRVHSVNCLGESDKYVQLEAGGQWMCWKDLTKKQRSSAYKMQNRITA
ncbi:MAG: cupin domain-containing protein [Gammaproteobacteria bacterium]|nr:cupin domain-containing protein [Gammaproteobacteria bacterium]